MKEYLDREREFTVNLMEKAWKWKCLSFATILAFFLLTQRCFMLGSTKASVMYFCQGSDVKKYA